MPLFETVFQEKPAIVLEIGSVYTKFVRISRAIRRFSTFSFDFPHRLGFSGEPHPRFILPTEIESIKDVLKKTDNSLYDQTAAFLTKLFFK
jgi:actin-related protein 10